MPHETAPRFQAPLSPRQQRGMLATPHDAGRSSACSEPPRGSDIRKSSGRRFAITNRVVAQVVSRVAAVAAMISEVAANVPCRVTLVVVNYVAGHRLSPVWHNCAFNPDAFGAG